MDLSPLWMTLWAVFCCAVATAAIKRKRNMWLWFTIAMLLTPPIAYLILRRLGERSTPAPRPVVICTVSKDKKPCTFCGACGVTSLAGER